MYKTAETTSFYDLWADKPRGMLVKHKKNLSVLPTFQVVYLAV